MKIGAVINYTSGTVSPEEAESRLEDIKHHLSGRVDANCLFIVSGGEVEQAVEKLKAARINALIIGGGDGTVSTVVRLIRDSDITLAVLALGTRNHFARDLNIPIDPVEAIQLLDRMNIHHIDLGEVNGLTFINNATIGIYPKIVEEREKRQKKHNWKKWRAHIAAALSILWALPSMRLVVEDDNGRESYLTPFLFVGNNEYQGGLLADASRSSLSEGCLWLCTASTSGLWSIMRMIWQFTIKGIQGIQDVDTKLLTHVKVYTRRPRVTVALDGENLKLDAPLGFKIIKKGLPIVVP